MLSLLAHFTEAFVASFSREPSCCHSPTITSSVKGRARGLQTTEKAQNVVEYGILVAVVVLVAAIGLNLMANAQRAYFAGFQNVVDRAGLRLTARPANPTSSTDASFLFESDYLVNDYTCSVDGNGWDCNAGTPWSPPLGTIGEGLRQFEVRALGIPDPTIYTWVVDLTDPNAPAITAPLNGGSYNVSGWSAGCGLCGTASDPPNGTPAAASGVQRVELQLLDQTNNKYWNGSTWVAGGLWLPAGGTTNWSYPFSASNFPVNGSYSLFVRAWDNVGHDSLLASSVFTVDTSPPSVTVERQTTSPTNSTTLTFLAKFSEVLKPTATLEPGDVSVSGPAGTVGVTQLGPPNPNWFTITITVNDTSPSGTVTVSIPAGVVADNAGNLNSASTAGTPPPTILYDKDVPTPVGVSFASAYTNVLSVPIVVSATDSGGSGLTEVCLSNSGSCTSWILFPPGGGTTWTLESGVDGSRTVSAWFRDGAGNATSTAISDTIIFDTTAPESLVVSFPVDNNTYDAASWNTASEAACGVVGRMCGTAADIRSGIAKVELAIRNNAGQYWDGAGWVVGATWVIATETNAWWYAFTPVPDLYRVQVRATDGAGNVRTEPPAPGLGFTMNP